MPTTNKVELIGKKEFTAAAIDKNLKTFVVHLASVIETMLIYLAKKALIAVLQADKASTKVSIKYLDYADFFLSNLAIELLENTSINEHAIKLIEEKQPSYRLIYALNPVKLEILKAYIKTHLKTGFI